VKHLRFFRLYPFAVPGGQNNGYLAGRGVQVVAQVFEFAQNGIFAVQGYRSVSGLE
jgi:hypothetical protein